MVYNIRLPFDIPPLPTLESSLKLYFPRILIGCLLQSAAVMAVASDPLPSWNAGSTKSAIVAFVEEVTQPNGADFVPAPERVAVFDNDGTLWSEQPVYFQLLFAMDRVKALAPDHPEWETQQPFQAVLEHDKKALLASGKKGLGQIIMSTHAGATTDEFSAIVTDWVNTARHPTLDRPYTELVYQPMLELLDFLRDNGFKTYIVSGGGIEFMRPWAERVYGIPPEQVIGSSIKTKFEIRDGEPQLLRLGEVNFVDDKEGKPVGINQHIGRRPILAFGNSDGDLQMLQWTAGNQHRSLIGLVHHTDGEREYAYDRKSHIGQLNVGLDEAIARKWTVVDMKADWNKIYPPHSQ